MAAILIRASFLGDPEKKTAEMLAEKINNAGGINGKKLELIIYDDEGDATKCNLAVKKLITRDKVCAVIGPSLSGLSLAVIPVAEEHKTPLTTIPFVKNNEFNYKWLVWFAGKLVQKDI